MLLKDVPTLPRAAVFSLCLLSSHHGDVVPALYVLLLFGWWPYAPVPRESVHGEGKILMSRWVTTTQPAAQLAPEPGEPEVQPDGTVVTYFRIAFGKRFARVVEKQGFTFWMREIDTP